MSKHTPGPFEGNIEEARIYDRALTPEEIATSRYVQKILELGPLVYMCNDGVYWKREQEEADDS